MSTSVPSFLPPCPYHQSLIHHSLYHRIRSSPYYFCSKTSHRRSRINLRCNVGPASSSSSKAAAPPSTFYQAINDAQIAVTKAFANGDRIAEVEFPPLPTSEMESASVSADDVSNANLRLAIDFGRKWATADHQVVVVLPDWIEKSRAMELCGGREEPVRGLRLGCLKDEKKGGWFERIWTKLDIDIAIRDNDDLFIIIGASAQELPDVENFVQAVGERSVVLFNLKLDTARGDLGLPAFPRKALHYRFLSRIRPVYYLRTRSYSRSLPRPPYVVNYSGALFRVFPGDYQVLLDTSRGRYRKVAMMKERPTLGVVRDCLTDSLDIEGLKGKKGSFLSKGYKSMTWWEEDRTKQESNIWRE